MPFFFLLPSAAAPVRRPPVADPAALLDAQRVRVRPVHETTQVVVLVHAAKCDPVAECDRHAVSKIQVVRDEQRLAGCEPHDETLVP